MTVGLRNLKATVLFEDTLQNTGDLDLPFNGKGDLLLPPKTMLVLQSSPPCSKQHRNWIKIGNEELLLSKKETRLRGRLTMPRGLGRPEMVVGVTSCLECTGEQENWISGIVFVVGGTVWKGSRKLIRSTIRVTTHIWRPPEVSRGKQE